MSLILPSYQSGFAPRDYEPAYPSLWQGCVGAWAPLLGPTGLALRDAVGKNDGVLTNGPTWDISGGRYALGFDGNNDSVQVLATRPAFQQATISFFALVRTTNNMLFVQIGGLGGVFLTQITAGKLLAFFDGTTGNNTSADESNTTIQTNRWYHIAATNDGSTTRYYIDGILDKSYSDTILQNSGTVYWIGSNSGTQQFVNGNLDDIRIYSRALNPNEIELLATRRGIAYEPKRTRKWYFRGFSPKKKLLEAKITSTVPGSYQTGYAPRDGEPVYPELWKNCVGAWSAGLGPSGLTLRDNSPAENHGTLVNGPTYQVSGGQYAINMDGTDDYVNIGDFAPLKGLTQYSVSCYVRHSSIAAGTQIAAAYKSTSTTAPILFQVDRSGGDYRFVVRDDSNSVGVATASGIAVTDTWVSLIGVRKGNGLSLFVNGKEYTGTGTFGAITANSVDIGATVAGGVLRTAFWQGNLDDVRLYNRALSESEIKTLATRRNIAYEYKRPRTLFRAYDPIKQVGVGKITSIIPGGYHTGVGGVNNEPAYPELTKGLVGGWCPSLGVTGGLLRDNSGQGNHGTLTNGPTWQISGGKYALDFDGVDDKVATNALSSLNSATRFTIAYWASKNSSLSDMIVGSRITGTNGVWLQWYSDGEVYFSVRNGQANFIQYSLPYRSDFIHFAATYSNTASEIYIDGKSVASGTNGTVSTTAFNDFAIGALAGGFFSAGKIDDVRLYSRVLSPNEIRLLASRRGIGYDYKTHRSYSKTQSSGLRKRILTGLP